jgi:hypothetical protein
LPFLLERYGLAILPFFAHGCNAAGTGSNAVAVYVCNAKS